MRETPKISFKYCISLGLASILSLWLGWQLHPLFLFAGLAPVLMIEAHIGNQKRGNLVFWLHCLGIMLGWNIAVTWWLAKASIVGAIVAIVLNALLMTLPLLAYRITRKILGNNYGYLTLILYWLSFEYLHLHWQLSWSWLTLGNAFATAPYLIQWYEYTGALGGSLWVLGANILVYLLVSSQLRHNRITYAIYFALLIGLPAIASIALKAGYSSQKSITTEVVIVQPNVDPYTQKFVESPNFTPYPQQMQRFLAQAKPYLSVNTRLLLLPETAFDEQYNEASLSQYPVFRQAQAFLKKYPYLAMITGATTSQFYGRVKPTTSARLHPKKGRYYEVFNTAVFLQESPPAKFYHKSKLVPGVETLPYPQVLGVLGDWLIDFGGTSGSYGTQPTREVFTLPAKGKDEKKIKIAPLICFESIHGDFTRRYIHNGATALAVITNDGWWGDTDGHHRHFAYTRLRAIETRRDVVFCANTGTSGVINQLGEAIAQTDYGKKAVLKQGIKSHAKITMYARHGDYLGRLSAFMAIGLILTMLVKKITKGTTGSFT
ncbi:apolipoprotein N-acyltransferase [uncultured Microscilla sp.]|uniref:apolipoprotein N-acyltransferase n=1 Tax=uncultured Microscilla sp. TaxID=432653 RepID=UPI002627549E|nr:apolipoprotein N-acyltransferase [uncultured Microscilla sp.]